MMDAPLRPWERWTLLAAVVVGLVIVAWLALPASRPAPPALTWSAIAPARDASVRPWRWIVIHHSATPMGNAAGIDRDHQAARGWDGIGYHFVIGNGQGSEAGRIEATFRWREQRAGAHAGETERNEAGIGICLIGDYTHAAPPDLLHHRLAALCALLIRHCPGLTPASIIGHGEVPGKDTRCPGRVDVADVRARVAAMP